MPEDFEATVCHKGNALRFYLMKAGLPHCQVIVNDVNLELSFYQSAKFVKMFKS